MLIFLLIADFDNSKSLPPDKKDNVCRERKEQSLFGFSIWKPRKTGNL